jgi:hypothetical protein
VTGKGYSDARPRFGLTLWSLVDSRWVAQILMRQPDYSIGGSGSVRLADVTADGYPDLLVERWPGTNHLCGPRQIFALSRRRARQIFDRQFCETYWKVRSGAVHFDEAWYRRSDSLCCPSFRRHFALRWNGRRLIRVSNRFVPERYKR